MNHKQEMVRPYLLKKKERHLHFESRESVNSTALLLVLLVQRVCTGFDAWFVCYFLFLTGTFALEADKVVYGLVFPIDKSDILSVQVSAGELADETEENTTYSNPQMLIL